MKRKNNYPQKTITWQGYAIGNSKRILKNADGNPTYGEFATFDEAVEYCRKAQKTSEETLYVYAYAKFQ